MLLRFLADAVVVLHFTFILCVIGGGLVTLWRPWFAYVHLPVAAWGVYISSTGRVCPLTTLENSLLREAGELGYSGGFIDHYLLGVIYPAGLTRSHQIVMAVAVLAVNITVYSLLWRRRNRIQRPLRLDRR